MSLKEPLCLVVRKRKQHIVVTYHIWVLATLHATHTAHDNGLRDQEVWLASNLHQVSSNAHPPVLLPNS